MDKTRLPYSAESPKRLLSGSQKLSGLRKRFGGGLHLALDNDVVMSYVRPQVEDSSLVADLLHDQNGFTANDQAISLADRVGRYILLAATKQGDGCTFSLPGHHAELWTNQAGGIHARLAAELEARGSTSQVSEQIQRFRNRFYHAALTKEGQITLADLLSEVPEQFMGWLGLGVAAQEWQRLQELAIKKILRPFSKEITDREYLSSAELGAYRQEIRAAIGKWRTRLDQCEGAWLRENPPAKLDAVKAARTEINIRHDAIALAFWERLNRDTYHAPHQRLMLVTGSERIMGAVNGLSAAELGGGEDEMARDYLLNPFDFLDECHLHLTGELHPEPDADKSGRLSTALEMLVNAGTQHDVNNAQREFGEMWGKFLRASVLERVQQVRNTRSKLLRQVAFVFSRAGITSESTKENPLVAELAERGSEMLSEAADIRVMSLRPELFTRGAPLLRLDKHPLAQKLQIRTPKSYCRLVTAHRIRPRLIQEAGHRYTLHLLQARAMIWAGDWRTALRLCNFSLAISDKLPPRADELISDTDGREATFLAAICERMVGGRKSEQLASALEKAQKRLDEFLILAAKAHEAGGITSFDLELHQVRAASEKLAIGTTGFLSKIFSSSNEKQAHQENHYEKLKGEMEKQLQGFVETRDRAKNLRSRIESSSSPDEMRFLTYLYFRISQQLWANELQIRISAPVNFGCGGADSLQDLWDEHVRLEQCESEILHELKIPDSWLIDICKKTLGCLLNKESGDTRVETIHKLKNAEQTESLFYYDTARFAYWRKLIES